MRWIKATVKYFLITLMVVAVAITAFLYLAPTFGAAPGGESLARIKASDHYRDGQFHNIINTQIDTSDPDQQQSIAAYFLPPTDKNPQSPLPSKSLDASLLTPAKFAWLGHSTILFNTQGKYILTDPVFNRASPIPLYGKPFPVENPTTIDDLPNIDVVIISHDHYDHLDHIAIMELNKKVDRFMVPLSHFYRHATSAVEASQTDSLPYGAHGQLRTPNSMSGSVVTAAISTSWQPLAKSTVRLILRS